MYHTNRLEAANAVMMEAEKVALQFFHERDRFLLEEKTASEFVSEADRQVEALIREKLADWLPDDSIMGEEMGGEGSDAFWSVDPIDGTANFLRGSPLWGVSIGFVEKGVSRVGVISYPSLGWRLSAADGAGVFKNGEPYRRRVDFPSVRVASVGESPRWTPEGIAEIELALRKEGWGVAEYRCATIGLGFAALGMTDGYIEKNTSIWDIAAGSVICAEAGLKVVSSGSYEIASQNIIAATDAVHAVVSRYF
ncbi:inositol monophosphatase family protein [Agrobacterium vitis]|uniref:inositol monophosphatase family protein n=1 Tax=Agrobacterium vitis TaxID=373 RepID=UPI00157496E4|nr:inositol monophosphatase family protein [Agrobacterium vitis]NSZ19638.1 myo-inositol-1-monophosphatase [Agrobacterium vitis]QZO06982.1 myo-inositol-1-monophosphatase [Agrobacterium vitis]UJL91413.1 myo-inositol-1-monophosphatase [Agrobacterium vitis]